MGLQCLVLVRQTHTAIFGKYLRTTVLHRRTADVRVRFDCETSLSEISIVGGFYGVVEFAGVLR